MSEAQISDRAPEAAAVPPERVREGLARVASSETLRGSPVLTKFLRFVVEETLAGRDQTLKEYTIAVGALGRPAKFDPATSAAVRVAARQLRFKLQAYYAGAGRDDPVLIMLPKGHYVPQFEMRQPGPDASASPPASRRRNAIAVTLAVLVAVVAFVSWSQTRNPAVQEESPPTIAVLPFANLTGTAAEDFIADGLADEVTSALAMDAGTRVIARSSAWTFKGARIDVREVGRQLGAAWVLEGSLHRAGAKYRVGLQLNAAEDGASVWAQQYEVEGESVFGLYDTIAQAVHEAVSARLQVPRGALPVRRTTRDARANALYLEGRFFWNRRTAESMTRAVELFEEAVLRDETFALGWAGLAGVLATMEVNHQTPPGESARRAYQAAERAVALDPTLGEPWATIGLLRGFVDWEWALSDSAFRRATALSPNYATARSWYSNTLLARGRVQESLAQLEAARLLDPLSMPVAYGIAQAHYYGRQWEAGLGAIDRVFDLGPPAHWAKLLQGKLLKGAGRTAEARVVFTELADSIELTLLAPLSERRATIPRHLARLSQADRDRSQFWIATVYAQLDQPDSVFAWLERAYAVHQPDLVSILTDPMIDPVKGDPRYARMVARIGLSAPPRQGPER